MTRREFIALINSATVNRPLGARAERPPERVLYFTYSAGYRHDVIPASEAILTQLKVPVPLKSSQRKTCPNFRPEISSDIPLSYSTQPAKFR